MGWEKEKRLPAVENGVTNVSGYDESILERARTQWQFGDWESLSTLEPAAFEHHPERGKLALLSAAGHMQCGRHRQARDYLQLAVKWGCSKKLVARMMVSSVHNSLGKAAVIDQRHDKALEHFEQALHTGSPGSETRLQVQARMNEQVAQLELHNEKSLKISGTALSLSHAKGHAAGLEGIQSKIKILETEMELLQHELGLAQTRGQLAPAHAPTPEGAIRRKAVSQLGQDIWVLERTSYKRDGFFVEFGATDGLLLSNTWLLEKEFGWKGICAEPNPAFLARLQNNRSCVVSPACIGPRTGETVQFVFASAYGAMQIDLEADQHAERRGAYLEAGHTATLQTISLHDLLVQYGAPREIDYISIDTEGSEFRILEFFPFDEWNVHHFTIEHNYTEQREKIHALLSRHGYTRIEQQWDDWYYR